MVVFKFKPIKSSGINSAKTGKSEFMRPSPFFKKATKSCNNDFNEFIPV